MFGEEGFTKGLLGLYKKLGISKKRFSGDGIYIGRKRGGLGGFFSFGKARKKVRKDENKIRQGEFRFEHTDRIWDDPIQLDTLSVWHRCDIFLFFDTC